MELHPRILEKDGEKQFVVLPYEEFERIKHELNDYEDLRELREAKRTEENAETRSLADVRGELLI
jgi:PHD/YefM family antitoxin component YafN of YafNO toxin-antitoxin module